MDSFFIFIAVSVVMALGSAYVLYRRGWLFFFAIALLTAGAVFLTGFSAGKMVFLAPFLLGAAGGYAYRSGRTLTFYVVASSLALAALFSGQYYYQTHVENIDMLGALKTQFEGMVKGSDAPADMQAMMIGDFSGWVDETGRFIIPFLFFLNGLAMAFLAFPFIRLFFRRFAVDAVKGLEYFRMVDYAIFTLIAGWGAVLLIDRASFGPVYDIALNLALIASMLYLIQALGVIKFMLLKKGIPSYLLPVSLVILMASGILVFGFAMVTLVGIGALDFWADFRKLEQKTI